jgi:hypothetical protein
MGITIGPITGVRVVAVVAAVAAVALGVGGCASSKKAGPKIENVGLATYLAEVRFEGVLLTAAKPDELSGYATPGDRVSLWFTSGKKNTGGFNLKAGKQALKGDWSAAEGTVSMTVTRVDDKDLPAGTKGASFFFRPPKHVDDPLVIFPVVEEGSEPPYKLFLVQNIGLKKYWQTKNGQEAKPSKTAILSP